MIEAYWTLAVDGVEYEIMRWARFGGDSALSAACELVDD